MSTCIMLCNAYEIKEDISEIYFAQMKKGSNLFFSQAMSQGGKCVCKCGWIVEVEILLAPITCINAATGLVAQAALLFTRNEKVDAS